jgi:predicted lipoprotein with Yx(FWY)xxD motif
MKNYLKPSGILALALTLFISCSDDEGEEKVEDVVEETGLTITTYDNGELGGILVNQDNQSMYFFAEDVNGQRNCDGGCFLMIDDE